jgi:ATP-dependent helicase HrpA
MRVSLFAQNLGTPYPISATRIYRALDQLRA